MRVHCICKCANTISMFISKLLWTASLVHFSSYITYETEIIKLIMLSLLAIHVCRTVNNNATSLPVLKIRAAQWTRHTSAWCLPCYVYCIRYGGLEFWLFFLFIGCLYMCIELWIYTRYMYPFKYYSYCLCVCFWYTYRFFEYIYAYIYIYFFLNLMSTRGCFNPSQHSNTIFQKALGPPTPLQTRNTDTEIRWLNLWRRNA